MYILVINCGSSSIKAAIVEDESGHTIVSALVQRIGEADPSLTIGADTTELGADGLDHTKALAASLPKMLEALPEGARLGGVGHRVVHGGSRFSSPVIINDQVEAVVEELIPLAPLHNPANLAGIRAARAVLSEVPHVAVFDTAFHATLPRRARAYALPKDLCERLGVQRYGFHGTSHAYVAKRAAAFLDTSLEDLRVITCHLGNGASVTAIEHGRSVETSMGLTPLEGLVMGTRSGDVDPGALFYIAREEGLDIDGLDKLLNKQSGLAGISGVGNDLRDIEARAAEGDDACQLAINVFTHRLLKYVGAYAAVLGGVDAIVFTGGIGENSVLIRARVAQHLRFLGAKLDEDRNRDGRARSDRPVVDISTATSRCKLLVVATDEQHSIAQFTAAEIREAEGTLGAKPIPVAVSARHVHLTQETVEKLFGEGHQLTPRNPLSQPGQFACEETVTLVGPRRKLEKVRILGPTRSKNQLEISRTDEFHLGLDAPVRASGDVGGSPGITVEGPAGTLHLEEGVVCAWRHIHMTPEDAVAYGVKDKDVVQVAIDSEGRDLVFGDVLVRVSPKYALEMHIDTDEANAAELSRGAEGMLFASGASARLVARKTT